MNMRPTGDDRIPAA